MTRNVAIGVVAAFASMIVQTASAGAADVSVLDRPGAIHMAPPQELRSRTSSGFSLVPPAAAAPLGSTGNLTHVPALRLTGFMMPGDAAKLRDTIDTVASYPAARNPGPLTTIELSSVGGSLMEGFEIGTLLRQRGLVAVVRSKDICLSACAFAFVGGNVTNIPNSYPDRCHVEIGGKLGFHNFFLNPAALRNSTVQDPVAARMQGFADASGGAAALLKYAVRIGMPMDFVSSLVGRPPDQFSYIQTVEQFISLNICPAGITRPSIPLEEQARNVCTNSLGNSRQQETLVVRALPSPQAKRYLLERLQAHLLASKASGPVARLLADGRVVRVEKEIDNLYRDLRLANFALPEIVGPTFEIGVNRAGKFEPRCYVSLSPDNPDKFDVVTFNDQGFSDVPRRPPSNAPRLFLFGKDTIVNPSPS